MMLKALILMAGLSLALTGTSFAAPYKMDAGGKCRDEHGKFAKQAFCEQHAYELDAKNKCRDEKGKFADAKFCHA